jgi:uncharacterized RDD family membrane protein YckC
MPDIKIPTALNIELSFETAPFHKRFFAWLIDVFIIFLYYIIVDKIYTAINPKFDENTANETWLTMIIALPAVLYHFLCELTMNGQSFGKKIFGLKIINADGGNATISQYMLRSLIRTIDLYVVIILLLISLFYKEVLAFAIFFFLLTVADFLCMTLTKKGQRLGDIAADTLLISTKSKNNLNETVFMEVANNYVPSYPQVMKLSDRDLNTIKNIYSNILKNNDYELANNTATKIQTVLKISPQHSDNVEFIETILKDYNFLSTQ